MLCSSIIFDIPDSTDILGFQYFRRNLLGEFSKLKTAFSAESMSVELALQAAMDGYEVVPMDETATRANIFVTATYNLKIIRDRNFKAMKDIATVYKIGNFDN